jgi:hypothetical protein
MKILAQRGFWPLRPTLTARGLELGCLLVAGLLALTLAISPAPLAGPPTQAVKRIGVPQAADLLTYRQHCIERILGLDLGVAEEYVVREINQQCLAPRRTTAGMVPFDCDRQFAVRFSPVARRFTGCLAT